MKRKLLALLFALFLFTACGENAITLGEIEDILPKLVEKSVPLNAIYFGEGFLPNGDAEASPAAGYYYADSMGKGFASISEIKEATEEVFTPAYAAILYAAAFDGVISGETVIAPRYIEGETGILQAIGTTVYDLPDRKYDFETLRIVESDAERAIVAVDTTVQGEVTTVELIVTRTVTADGNVYRLDSPTY